jgi:predicted enzyme related to lactoylglutathione lyase
MWREIRFAVGVGGLLAVSISGSLTAQGPANDKSADTRTPAVSVLHTEHFSPTVADLDRSMAFYRDVLGLEIQSRPAPNWDSTSWLRALHGTGDAPLRYAIAKVPGTNWGVEMVEFRNADRHAVAPRVQDPGSTTVAFSVRDLDAALARVKRAGTQVVSAGSEPTGSKGGNRAIVLRDPDGFLVELFELVPSPVTTAPASSNVIGGGKRIVVEDLDRTLALYRDQLGWPFGQPTPSDTKSFRALTGLEAKSRHSVATSPDGALYELVEFQGVDRTPLRTRVQDPGSTRFYLVVSDLDAALARFKAAGGSIISTGGQPVVGNGTRYAAVRDPNGVFFVLSEGRN